MNTRIVALFGLVGNYSFLIVFGLLLVTGINYFFNGGAHAAVILPTMVIVNTFMISHMRNYWVDLVLGDRTKHLTHRPGFTDEILDRPNEKTGNNNDLNELLKVSTKKPTKHSELKRNPLDD